METFSDDHAQSRSGRVPHGLSRVSELGINTVETTSERLCAIAAKAPP